MKTTLLNTSWTTNSRGEQTPQIAVDYNLIQWSDYTGQDVRLPDNPSPNLTVIHITCDDTIATNIQNDSNYTILTDNDGVLGFLDVGEDETPDEVISIWLNS